LVENFRCLLVRYDRSFKMYWTFSHIACFMRFMITLRKVVQREVVVRTGW